MEKIPKSPSESNNNQKKEEPTKTEQEKTISNTKETSTINSINISQKNDNFFRTKNTNNNNLFQNSESLYPLLFT